MNRFTRFGWLLIHILFFKLHALCVNNGCNNPLVEDSVVKSDFDKIIHYLKLGVQIKSSKPHDALFFLNKALTLSSKIASDSLIVECSNEIGLIYWNKGELQKASSYFSKALKKSEQSGNKSNLSKSYYSLGLFYWKKGVYNDGLKYLLKALKISEESKNLIGTANAYYGMGLIYWAKTNYEKSLEYHWKAIDIRKELSLKNAMAESYHHIGLVYMSQKIPNKALYYYLTALHIYEDLEDKAGIQIMYNFLGMVYMRLKEFKIAEDYCMQSLVLAKELQNKDEIALTYLNISGQYLNRKQFKSSIEYSLDALEVTKQEDLILYQKLCYRNLFMAYDSLNNYKNAYEYHKLFKQTNDSLFNESNTNQIIEMQTVYDTEKKEKENQLLKKSNELQHLTIKKEANYRNYLLIISILILILVILLLKKIEDKKRSEMALEQKVKIRTWELEKAMERAEENQRLKSVFLANISREIKTPMNGILSFSELLKKPQLNGKRQLNFIEKIQNSGEQMLSIINNLVDLSKIESNQMETSFSTVNINHEIQNLHIEFENLAKEKGIEFSFSTDLENEDAHIKIDHYKLLIILTNFLKNSFKFTLNGCISFGYSKKLGFLEFFVNDTGIGIPDDLQEIIFERSIKAEVAKEKQYNGAGLGLPLSKALVEMMGGKIWVKSEFWSGSQFYFTVPYLKAE